MSYIDDRKTLALCMQVSKQFNCIASERVELLNPYNHGKWYADKIMNGLFDFNLPEFFRWCHEWGMFVATEDKLCKNIMHQIYDNNGILLGETRTRYALRDELYDLHFICDDARNSYSVRHYTKLYDAGNVITHFDTDTKIVKKEYYVVSVNSKELIKKLVGFTQVKICL